MPMTTAAMEPTTRCQVRHLWGSFFRPASTSSTLRFESTTPYRRGYTTTRQGAERLIPMATRVRAARFGRAHGAGACRRGPPSRGTGIPGRWSPLGSATAPSRSRGAGTQFGGGSNRRRSYSIQGKATKSLVFMDSVPLGGRSSGKASTWHDRPRLHRKGIPCRPRPSSTALRRNCSDEWRLSRPPSGPSPPPASGGPCVTSSSTSSRAAAWRRGCSKAPRPKRRGRSSARPMASCSRSSTTPSPRRRRRSALRRARVRGAPPGGRRRPRRHSLRVPHRGLRGARLGPRPCHRR